ncbi:MAG TPA: DUF3558 domain-containing protein [Pseudonocardiaceae bacterium]|nr:DUF3558 domain-containing protein [Pseudonocardiaceae bacterium]
MGLRLAVGTAVTVMALAGCTSTQTGQAKPAGGASPTYQVPTNGAGAISLPPRPSDIPLTGVDPCTLLIPAQQTTLGVTAGRPGPPAQLLDNSPTCNYRFADHTPGAEYTIAVDTVAGIQRYLDPNLADVIKPVLVNGFPALDVTLKPPDLLQGCTTVVSVANGQMFTVNLGQPAKGTTTTQSCARTEQVAAAVLATVQTRK